MTLSEWIKIWLKTYKTDLSYNGRETIKYCLKHIKKAFGTRKIAEIKGYEIQQFLNTLNHIPNMQHKVKTYLNDILEYACRNRIIEYNAMLAVKFKKQKGNNENAMSIDTQKVFIQSLEGKPYKLLFMTYLYTGARRNEVIMPDSISFDLKADVVRINGTKSHNAVRTVPLFKPLKIELLKELNYKSYYTQFKPDTVTKTMKRHREEYEIGKYNVRSLRTTFATRCRESGVPIEILQRWLGHADYETTANVYIDKDTLTLPDNLTYIDLVQKTNNYLM